MLRIHPLSLVLRRLKGERTIHGRRIFDSRDQAAATLRELTGQDFGIDAAAWGAWLRQNRWVYYARHDDPRLTPASAAPRPAPARAETRSVPGSTHFAATRRISPY